MKAAAPKMLREYSEILILPNGKILAHNMTPEMAAILSELDPKNEAMKKRATKRNRSK